MRATGFARGTVHVRWLWLLALCACERAEPTPFSYYDERIAPIIDTGCQRQTTGCHVDNGDGFALGNLDLSSYDAMVRREDVLVPYGPYSVPLLLLKGGGPTQVRVETLDPPDPDEPERRYVTITTDIRHGGGEGAIAEGSSDFSTLKQWLDGGYSPTGVPSMSRSQNLGNCSDRVGRLPGVDLDEDPADDESYRAFVEDVQPVLRERCAGSRCHGTPVADLRLSCGDDDRQLRWNYAVTIRHLSEVAVTSELLRRPLSLQNGGIYHEGGNVFPDTEDLDYRALLRFAEDIAERRPELLRFTTDDEGLAFFANRVQPALVRKGCMFLGCHAPAMFHDLRLRGGSRGDFSEIATRRNYEMSRLMLALESDDPNDSRLIAKNLCAAQDGGGGVKHRGGALFEDFGGCGDPERQASLDKCAQIDADAGDLNEIPAYCVLARWHQIERERAIADGDVAQDPLAGGIVFVIRPPGLGDATDFDSYRPGADLVRATVSYDPTADPGSRMSLGDPQSLLGGCGLAADVDVRGPAVSWDGRRIAFAARDGEDRPLRLYQMASDGGDCGPIAGLAPERDEEDGILTHDFDPAYAPDGRLVFASSRGNIAGAGERRPTRTPAAMQPNSNLFVFDFDSGALRQLTFLLNQELMPGFMADGRVILTAEKRAEDFHQLAGRRQNLDGGDYHPLFAQRDSIGFEAATEIVELANRNLAFTAAPIDGEDGGGAIVVVNRSIGPDQDDRPRGDRAYIHSLTTPASGAFGGDSGVFRSPAPLPTGELIVSCDLTATDITSGPHHYGLCELDPSGRADPRMLYEDPARVAVEAVAVVSRVEHEVFESRMDEPNGSTRVVSSDDDAVVHITDAPLLGTLLFANTREGRPIDPRIAGIEVLMPRPPPAGTQSFGDVSGRVVEDAFGRYFEDLESLGRAGLRSDGSIRLRVPGGVPLTLALTDGDGSVLSFGDGEPFSGPMRQREALQLYPGERLNQSIPREFFDGLCAGCHGSISGRELDIGIDVDILTSASRTQAGEAVDLR